MALAPPTLHQNPDVALRSALSSISAKGAPAENKPKITPTSTLAAHVRTQWEEAVRFRQEIKLTDRMLACLRQCTNRYEPDEEAMIAAAGGSKLYFGLTETKRSTLEAWIMDVFSPYRERPWSLEGTPIPDLPADVQQQILNKVVAEAQRVLAATGQPMAGPDAAMMAIELADEARTSSQRESDERIQRMAEKMEDQLAEGGWIRAFDEFVKFLTVHPYGIIKGPVICNKRRMKWETDSETGQTVAKGIYEPIPMWFSVDPMDFYPGPNQRTPDEGFVCEIVSFSKYDLSNYRGIPGWNTAAIDRVLRGEHSQGESTSNYETGKAERDEMQDRETVRYADGGGSTVEGIEFWGCASGKDLKEWEAEGVIESEGVEFEGDESDESYEKSFGEDVDDLKFYPIRAIVIGGDCVHASFNPDPMARVPYGVCSVEELPGTMIGRALAEKIRDCQKSVNCALRNMMDNVAIAARPFTAIDIDLLDPSEDVAPYPGRAYQYHGNKRGVGATAGKAVEWWEMPLRSQELMQVAEYFEAQADNRSQIPRYAHGDQNVQGAAATVGGLEMLMNNAFKGIRLVVANIDTAIRRAVEMLYVWNLQNLDEPEFDALKGDIRVIPRGAVQMLLRERTQAKQLEFLDRAVQSPEIMSILGQKGLLGLLTRIFEQTLELGKDNILPTPEQFEAQQQAQAAAQAQMAAQGQLPPPDGAPAQEAA